MKLPIAALTLALLAGCSSGSSEGNAAPAAREVPAAASGATAAGTSAEAEGTVEAVDPAAQTITIAHGPVASLNWPAMTMTFKAGAVDTTGMKQGDKIAFTFTSTGMDGTLTAVERQ